MKTGIFTISFLSFLALLIFSCTHRSEGSDTGGSYGNAGTGSSQDDARRQDSIKAANAKIAEGKDLGYNDASKLIDDSTISWAKQVSPVSYEKATYSIDSANATYNLYSGTYSVPFQSGWNAFVHGAGFDSAKQWHAIYGKLTLYGNGQKRVRIDSVNQALSDAVKANQGYRDAADFIDFLNKLDDASKQNDQSGNN